MKKKTPLSDGLTDIIPRRISHDPIAGSGTDDAIRGRLRQLIRPLVHGLAGNAQRLGQLGRSFEQMDGFSFRHGRMVSMFTSPCQHPYQLGKYSFSMVKLRIMDLAERIIGLRKSRNWSQGELANRLGIERPTVTQWESGKTKNIRNDNLLALAQLFNMTVDELLTGQPPMTIQEPPGSYKTKKQPHTREEQILIEKYRHLDPRDRKRLQDIANALDADFEKKAQ